jgi:hypothetical protein
VVLLTVDRRLTQIDAKSFGQILKTTLLGQLQLQTKLEITLLNQQVIYLVLFWCVGKYLFLQRRS